MNYASTSHIGPANVPSDSLATALSAIDDQRDRLPSLIDRLERLDMALNGPKPAAPSTAEKLKQADSLVWRVRATAEGLGSDIQHMFDVLDNIERAIGL